MIQFIDGALMMSFLVVALFFLRFWRGTRDRFFLLFSIAFWILAVNRALLVAMSPPSRAPAESHVLLYVIRLLAFLVLLAAIIDKNRAPKAGGTRAS